MEEQSFLCPLIYSGGSIVELIRLKRLCVRLLEERGRTTDPTRTSLFLSRLPRGLVAFWTPLPSPKPLNMYWCGRHRGKARAAGDDALIEPRPALAGAVLESNRVYEKSRVVTLNRVKLKLLLAPAYWKHPKWLLTSNLPFCSNESNPTSTSGFPFDTSGSTPGYFPPTV